VRHQPTPRDDDALRELLGLAARSLGVATQSDLRDYFRMPAAGTAERIAELVDEGAVIPVTVEGWKQPAFLHADADIPARVTPRALISPFDSLIWERARTERLFGFHYRIEIYTPAENRRFGYYVLPFLFGDRLVARVDLKADRAAATLRVLSAHAEPRIDRGRVAAALAGELTSMAGWLGLERVKLEPRGDFAGDLDLALKGIG